MPTPLLVYYNHFDVYESRNTRIHPCSHEAKRFLYKAVYQMVEPGGIFRNLKHVSAP